MLHHWERARPRAQRAGGAFSISTSASALRASADKSADLSSEARSAKEDARLETRAPSDACSFLGSIMSGPGSALI